MNKIPLKPLSVNDSYGGRKKMTPDLREFKEDCFKVLPRGVVIPKGKLEIFFRFGLSSKSGDWDNPIKPFQDILQEAYEFNDKMIYKGTGEKVDVAKGEEFIEFEIKSFDN